MEGERKGGEYVDIADKDFGALRVNFIVNAFVSPLQRTVLGGGVRRRRRKRRRKMKSVTLTWHICLKKMVFVSFLELSSTPVIPQIHGSCGSLMTKKNR